MNIEQINTPDVARFQRLYGETTVDNTVIRMHIGGTDSLEAHVHNQLTHMLVKECREGGMVRFEGELGLESPRTPYSEDRTTVRAEMVVVSHADMKALAQRLELLYAIEQEVDRNLSRLSHKSPAQVADTIYQLIEDARGWS